MIAALLLAAAPVRIVSNNPCTDALLAELVAPERVVAVSHYSHDPRSRSSDAAWLVREPAIGMGAEPVVALQPDLFVTGAPLPRQTAQVTRRLGVRTLSLPVPQSIAESRAQITRLAAAVGAAGAGAQLNARIDAAIARARWNGPAMPALIRNRGGLVPGTGTLSDELLRLAGFTNASAALGLRNWDVLPLEPLLRRPPRVIFTDNPNAPGLRRLGSRVVPYPDRMLFCGGPTIIGALDRLRAARAGLR